jgi:ferric-dicitrate binding protein FerR (iron transport regulator)
LQGADGKSQILTANTAKGQTYQFTLPDGTKVWLNAGSKLEFPSSFVNSKARSVKLSGEGYFEVAKDKAHPFIVETDLQNIEVLGTHFNVNSYADEPDTRTTLLEGSVQVTPKHLTPKQAKAKAQVMMPGQQAILDKRFDIQLKQVTDLEYFIAWRASGANDPGSMAFDNNTLEEVMRRISRWYNVTVEYRGNVKRDIRFSGMIKRNVPLSKVLRLLEATTGSAEFKIEGRRLIVMN